MLRGPERLLLNNTDTINSDSLYYMNEK
jgi:hypothetical protein